MTSWERFVYLGEVDKVVREWVPEVDPLLILLRAYREKYYFESVAEDKGKEVLGKLGEVLNA